MDYPKKKAETVAILDDTPLAVLFVATQQRTFVFGWDEQTPLASCEAALPPEELLPNYARTQGITDSPKLCTRWSAMEEWRSCDSFRSVLGITFATNEQGPAARVYLVDAPYEIPLLIDDPRLVCLQIYTVGNDVKAILAFSWGSLVRLSGIHDPASVSVDYMLHGSLDNESAVVAVAYHPHWQCLAYASEEGVITVVDDTTLEELLYKSLDYDIVDLLCVKNWVVIIGNQNCWLFGYNASKARAIDWWRRPEVERLIDGSHLL